MILDVRLRLRVVFQIVLRERTGLKKHPDVNLVNTIVVYIDSPTAI